MNKSKINSQQTQTSQDTKKHSQRENNKISLGMLHNMKDLQCLVHNPKDYTLYVQII